MPETLDLNIRALAFGRPSLDSAYVSFTTPEGNTYRFHFSSKRQVSLIRSESSKTEDLWPEPATE